MLGKMKAGNVWFYILPPYCILASVAAGFKVSASSGPKVPRLGTWDGWGLLLFERANLKGMWLAEKSMIRDGFLPSPFYVLSELEAWAVVFPLETWATCPSQLAVDLHQVSTFFICVGWLFSHWRALELTVSLLLAMLAGFVNVTSSSLIRD